MYVADARHTHARLLNIVGAEREYIEQNFYKESEIYPKFIFTDSELLFLIYFNLRYTKSNF